MKASIDITAYTVEPRDRYADWEIRLLCDACAVIEIENDQLAFVKEIFAGEDVLEILKAGSAQLAARLNDV